MARASSNFFEAVVVPLIILSTATHVTPRIWNRETRSTDIFLILQNPIFTSNSYPHAGNMDEATPRVTMPLLENFQHRTVRILGRVTQLRGEQAAIDAGGQITLHLNRV